MGPGQLTEEDFLRLLSSQGLSLEQIQGLYSQRSMPLYSDTSPPDWFQGNVPEGAPVENLPTPQYHWDYPPEQSLPPVKLWDIMKANNWRKRM